MANKAMHSTGRELAAYCFSGQTPRGSTRRSSPKGSGEVGRTGRTRRWGRGLDQLREPLPEGDDGGGGEGLMRQSRGNMAIGRAPGRHGHHCSRLESPDATLGPGVLLRTSGPLRPPSDEQWGTQEVDKTLRLAKGRTGMLFGDNAHHEQAITLAWECSPPN